jgi:hypothetical protein
MATKPQSPSIDADAAAALQPTGPSDPAAIDALRLGERCMVQVVPGFLLRNNESGGYFQHATPTPQTVTTTLLHRLRDGDLFLVG